MNGALKNKEIAPLELVHFCLYLRIKPVILGRVLLLHCLAQSRRVFDSGKVPAVVDRVETCTQII